MLFVCFPCHVLLVVKLLLMYGCVLSVCKACGKIQMNKENK